MVRRAIATALQTLGACGLLLLGCTSKSSSKNTTSSGGAGATGGASGGSDAGSGASGGLGTGGSAGGSGSAGAGGNAGTGGQASLPVLVGTSTISVPRGFAVSSSHAFVSGEPANPGGTAFTQIVLSTGAKNEFGAGALWGIAADDSGVYAADFEGLRLFYGGISLANQIDLSPRKPYLVALTPSHVFLDDEQNASVSDILSFKRSDGFMSVIATGVPTSWQLLADGTELFAAGYDAPTLHVLDTTAAPVASPPAAFTATIGGAIRALAVNGTHIFASTWQGSCSGSVAPSSAIYRLDRKSPGQNTALMEVPGISAMALSATHLYVAQLGPCNAPGQGSIRRSSLLTPDQFETVVANQEVPEALVVRGSALYWMNAGLSTSTVRVWRLDL